MKHLYLDCSAGISGDMLLGVFGHLGVDFSALEKLFADAGLEIELRCQQVRVQDFVGMRARVMAEEKQPCRHLADLRLLLEKLSLSPVVQRQSLGALERLAVAEAAVHGCAVEEVHFHEVGAVDTLVDIVGAFWSLEQLGCTQVFCSSLPWFQGQVHCAHGQIPLPAPATIELLRGKPVYPTDRTEELITPTGAVLVDQMVTEFVSGPQGCIVTQGVGFGSRESEHVNALRGLLVEVPSESLEQVAVLETNLDHLTGEEIGAALQVLMDRGALDVLFLPGVMKKNRPGGLLQVLCRVEDILPLRDVLFAETLSSGVRVSRMERWTLPRRESFVQTRLGDVASKEIELDGEYYSRPEYEALKALAQKTGRSVTQLRYLLKSS